MATTSTSNIASATRDSPGREDEKNEIAYGGAGAGAGAGDIAAAAAASGTNARFDSQRLLTMGAENAGERDEPGGDDVSQISVQGLADPDTGASAVPGTSARSGTGARRSTTNASTRRMSAQSSGDITNTSTRRVSAQSSGDMTAREVPGEITLRGIDDDDRSLLTYDMSHAMEWHPSRGRTGGGASQAAASAAQLSQQSEAVTLMAESTAVSHAAGPEPSVAVTTATRVDDVVVEATPLKDEDGAEKYLCILGGVKLKKSRRGAALVLGLVLLLLAVILIPSVLLTRSNRAVATTGSPTTSPAPTTATPSAQPTSAPTSDRYAEIAPLVRPISGDAIDDSTTPQYRALDFIANDDPLQLSPSDPHLIQRYSLMVLYYSLGGEAWTSQPGYVDGEDDCSFFLIQCNAAGEVETLQLQTLNLEGTIPKEIAELSVLKVVWMEYNRIGGSVPSAIGKLTLLEELVLTSNLIEGTIPVELYSLTNLIRISLAANPISGTISPSIGNLTRLNEFDMWNMNLLTGSVPTEIGRCRSLSLLRLKGAFLTGTIPTELGDLTLLRVLSLKRNQITGTIPSELGRLTRLENILLDTNQLSGTIPPAIGDLTRLVHIKLHWNELSGTMPPALCDGSGRGGGRTA